MKPVANQTRTPLGTSIICAVPLSCDTNQHLAAYTGILLPLFSRRVST
jgi:hypothetical protein